MRKQITIDLDTTKIKKKVKKMGAALVSKVKGSGLSVLGSIMDFFTISRIFKACFVLLLLIGAFFIYKDIKNGSLISLLTVSNSKLNQQLKYSLEIKGSKVKYIYRAKDGTTKEKIVYVPNEGSVKVLTPKDKNKPVQLGIFGKIFSREMVMEDGNTVWIKRGGLCFRPGISALVDSNVQARMGVNTRLFFFERWGTGPGVAPKLPRLPGTTYFYGFVDRRIDDIIPFLRNSRVGAFYGTKGTFGGQFSTDF